MAMTLTELRNQIATSIFGRRLGLDQNDFLVAKGTRNAVNAATSDTTGTNIANAGYTSVETTTNDGWKLDAPAVGGIVSLFTISTSTGIRVITPVNATVVTSAGTAGSTIGLYGYGGSVTLVGISTAAWAVLARSSTALCDISS
jgi:hypothetical protein